MELRDDELGFLITDRLQPFFGGAGGYVVHAVCTAGEAALKYNGREVSFRRGDALIIRSTQLLTGVRAGADFAVRVIALTPTFVSMCAPQSNYGARGAMFLFHNPVMQLDEEELVTLLRDFDDVERRARHTSSRFYRDLLVSVTETLFLDFFDFHARLNPEGSEVKLPASRIVSGFFALLSEGNYRSRRDIGWYADRLCVSPKHLSDTCKQISGYSANYWITRFTVTELRRLLRDKRLTLTDVAVRLGFTSQAYFCRYVQRHLGDSPSAFR